ncbi:M14 family zinc carboxypeptidase [Streptomyces sp. HNM0574]|uniref:M14 family zinc carboxypeptidase n=1 Tax=Streptomyces sp. HNM0574 TaxID=2714954 RepID=UPI00146E39D4|nr:M14 family zinc carboxypeptidase [Streptomyces sp. HNM0574]NLU70742.1 zinc carboxypeptidase [Streptomyces sp. HNM0574]
MRTSAAVRRPGALCAALATAVLGASVTVAPSAHATPPIDTCQVQENPSWDGWTDHGELTRELKAVERRSDGRVRVDKAGTTAEGRTMWRARAGQGKKVVLVTSAIHGNERTGTEALLEILDHLGTSDDPETRALLRRITFVAMPMVNPDGGELNRRMNVLPWDRVTDRFPQLAGAPRAWYHAEEGDGIAEPGFDLNRDFNPDLDYVPRAADLPGEQTDPGFFLSPESRAIRDTYVQLRQEKGHVETYVDLHHMGPCDRLTSGPQKGKLISMAIDYPPLGVRDGAKYKKQWPALDQDKSRRYALAAAKGIHGEYGMRQAESAIGRYVHPDEREYPGQGRSAFALNGTGTVLFEVRGQSDDLGEQHKEVFTATVRTGVESIMKGVATGSADRLDGEEFFTLPTYGWDEKQR